MPIVSRDELKEMMGRMVPKKQSGPSTPVRKEVSTEAQRTQETLRQQVNRQLRELASGEYGSQGTE